MKNILSITSLLVLILASSSSSLAQNLSSEELSYQRTQDRLERLEKSLNLLEKQTYRGSAKSGGVDSGSSNGPRAQIRIDELEEQMRQLNGRLEEIEFSLNNLSNKVDNVAKDIEFRLREVENSNNQSVISQRGEDGKYVAVEDGLDPIALDSIKSDIKREDIEEIKSEDGGISSQYGRAFSYLRSGDYLRAEKEFNKFITENPESELLQNAYYWLGETYYVRQDYGQAATKFLKGYRKYPDGKKAIDNLLKLAMSLGKLGKVSEACTSFNKLESEFPDMEESVEKILNEQKSSLGCS